METCLHLAFNWYQFIVQVCYVETGSQRGWNSVITVAFKLTVTYTPYLFRGIFFIFFFKYHVNTIVQYMNMVVVIIW